MDKISIAKDKIVFKSILEQDLPEFFKQFINTKNINNINNINSTILNISGLNSKNNNFSYEEMREYFQNELERFFEEEGSDFIEKFNLLKNFFNNVSDNFSILEEDNKKYFIYLFSYLFRTYYNYTLLNTNFNINNINNEIISNSNISNIKISNSKSISLIKSFANEDEEIVAQSFVCLSEILFYFFDFNSYKNIDFNDYREMLTHGITGCFLLDEGIEETLNLLNCNYNLPEIYLKLT